MSDLKVFQCPNCKKFINNTSSVCKFCSFELDAEMISRLVSNQEKVDTAYNSASKLRILAGMMWVLFFLSLIPFWGFVFRWIFYVVAILIPVLLIVWYVRYGNLKTLDPEFNTAKKYLYSAFFIWLIYPVINVIFLILIFIGLMAIQNQK